jgi:hypothetical protein
MNAQEREFVVSELRASEAKLLASFHGLTAAQWSFRESAERWSIAENLEHLILFERFIRAAVLKMLEGDGDAQKRAAIEAKFPAVLRIAETRETRIETRDVVRPTGRWQDTHAMVSMLQRERGKTIAFAETTHDALETHYFAHLLLGDLNAYQWLVLMAKHSERHVLQMEEIKRATQYPR